jgi:hypothetical protein
MRMTILFTTVNETTHPRESRAQPPDTTSQSSGTPYWALIDRSDDALLDFNTEGYEVDIDHARALLAQRPTTYRNHLAIAKFIEGWIARITNDAKPSRFNDGFVEALLEMADHLRDGDFVVDEGVAVGHGGPVRTTDVASTNGDVCARGHAHQRRRTVLVPTDLSGRATVIRAQRAAAPNPAHSAPRT